MICLLFTNCWQSRTHSINKAKKDENPPEMEIKEQTLTSAHKHSCSYSALAHSWSQSIRRLICILFCFGNRFELRLIDWMMVMIESTVPVKSCVCTRAPSFSNLLCLPNEMYSTRILGKSSINVHFMRIKTNRTRLASNGTLHKPQSDYKIDFCRCYPISV